MEEKKIYTKKQAENLSKALNKIMSVINKSSNEQFEDITVTQTGLMLGFKSYKSHR